MRLGQHVAAREHDAARRDVGAATADVLAR